MSGVTIFVSHLLRAHRIYNLATNPHPNAELADLLQSASDRYMDHGLFGTDFSYFIPTIFADWQKSPTNTVFRSEGMFSLPICEATEEEWRNMNEGAADPPCSCRE
jgi:hypothetical protein